MNITYSAHQLSSQLQLQRTHRMHYSSREFEVMQNTDANKNSDADSTIQSNSFADLLSRGLSSVSDQQQHHEALAVRSVLNPDQVDAHDVTIAAAKADLSIRLARNIIDRTLNAYREITSLR